jgi:hypothetical protein
MFVILNEVKNLIISTESIIEILRLSPQNDIVTQSLAEECNPRISPLPLWSESTRTEERVRPAPLRRARPGVRGKMKEVFSGGRE